MTPRFSFGCGSNDGTASCDLGAVDAQSAKRQLQAQVPVPVGASTVKSVTLTVIGSAARLAKDPMASASVTITAAATTAPQQQQQQQQVTTTTPLSVTTLPDIPSASPTLSPGGNAAGLFPSLQPSADPSHVQKANTRPVADTSALPEGSPVVGAQLAGLLALGLAFILTVTRLSVRRRPVPAQPASPPSPAAAPPVPAPPAAAAAAARPGAKADDRMDADEAQAPAESAPAQPPAESAPAQPPAESAPAQPPAES